MCAFEIILVILFHVLLSVSVQGLTLRRFIEGDDGSLPCKTDAPVANDQMTLVLWYKDGSEAPIYGLDARTLKGEFPSHFVQPQLGSRAYFNSTVKNPALIVKPVKKSDAGLYRCRVDFAHSRTINYFIKLDIIVPPLSIVIKTEEGRVSNGTIGPYKEGYSTIISCEVTGGDPKPIVSIRINGRITKDYFLEEEQLKSNGDKRSILLIRKDIMVKNLTREDFDSNVVCEANNSNISSPIYASSKIKLDLPPLSATIEPKDAPLLNGERTVIFCRSIGAYPPPIFQWYLGSRKLIDGISQSTSTDKMTSTSMLELTPAIADNGAVIKCRAFSPNIKARPKEDQRNLTVLYLPVIKLSSPSHPKNVWVKENDELEIKCLNDANPPATDIQWFYNTLPIDGSFVHEVMSEKDSITIKNISKEQSGQYWCQVVNEIGSVSSKKMLVEVKYTPRCVSNLKLIHGIGMFETGELLCQVDSLPPHVTFSWFFKNKHQEFRLGTIESENTSSIASYTPRNKQDYGELHCSAKNSIGGQRDPCVFKIIHADAPDPVTNCSISNHTENSLTVECIPGYDGGLEQTFITEVYQKWTHVLKANLSSETTPSFEVVGLPPDTNFVVIVYSANTKGRSHSLALTTNTLSKSRGWYHKPSSLTTRNFSGNKISLKASIKPVIAILIGIVVAVVIFVVIIVVITRVIASKKRNAKLLKKPHEPSSVQETDDKYNEHKARDPLLQPEIKPDATPFCDANANNQHLFNNDLKSQDSDDVKKKLHYEEDEQKKEDDITYAELCFPPNAEPRKIISKESPTEYAKIIVKKKKPDSVKDDGSQESSAEAETSSQNSDQNSPEKPLICIHIESSV